MKSWNGNKEDKDKCLWQEIEDIQRPELFERRKKIGYLQNQQKILNE